jgi:hypothetical protein
VHTVARGPVVQACSVGLGWLGGLVRLAWWAIWLVDWLVGWTFGSITLGDE